MRNGAAWGLLVSLLLAWAISAVAVTPAEAEAATACIEEHVPGVGYACVLADGHFEVQLKDGTKLLTHGPDPKTGDVGPGFGSGSDERAPKCGENYRMHVLYGYPSGRTDRSAEVANDIRGAVKRMNAVLNAEAMKSGNVNADYNIVCDDEGEIRIDVFSGASSSAEFQAIADAASAAGYRDARTDHLIFWDGTSTAYCGVANIYYDESLSSSNGNIAGPDYAVVFAGCWFGRTPMHENGHNQGAVQRLAPMSDLAGHCLEGYDVMCYTSDFIVLCSDRMYFDCNHDTYFNAAPAAGSYLATHWNIGSRLNPYVTFSDEPEEPEPTPTPSKTSSSPSKTTKPTTSTSKTTKTTKPRTTTPRTSHTQATGDAVAEETAQDAEIQAAADEPAPAKASNLLLPGLLAAGAMAAILARRRR